MRMQFLTSVGEPHPALLIHTPAKLNLFLNVLGKREDGFHDLETLMVSIRLFDTIHFESSKSPKIELRCRSRLRPLTSPVASIPTDSSNLVVRAALLLQQEAGCSLGANIHLEKRIPIQAGLGGGSSDAAATLVGLNAFWNLGLSTGELHQLAAQLGSDVNFFLDSATVAVCTGRGEHSAPITTARPLHFVLIKPPSGLSTGAVFQEWSNQPETETPSIKQMQQAILRGDLQELSASMFNSLEQPASRLNDEVRAVLNLLKQYDTVCAAMTGSGSTCFALCRSRQHALRLASSLRARRIGDTFAVSSGV